MYFFVLPVCFSSAAWKYCMPVCCWYYVLPSPAWKFVFLRHYALPSPAWKYACLLALCTSITCLKVCLSGGIMHFHHLPESLPFSWHYALPCLKVLPVSWHYAHSSSDRKFACLLAFWIFITLTESLPVSWHFHVYQLHKSLHALRHTLLLSAAWKSASAGIMHFY